jgi:hypothetical protein
VLNHSFFCSINVPNLSFRLINSNLGQLEKFVDELESYMIQQETDWEARLNWLIPAFTDLRTIRMSDCGMTGIGVLTSLILYDGVNALERLGLTLYRYAHRARDETPGNVGNVSNLLDVPYVKEMCHEVKTIVWLTNDLWYFDNFKDTENVDIYDQQFMCLKSATVLFKESGCTSLQAAIDEVYGLLVASIKTFEGIAEKLLLVLGTDKHRQEAEWVIHTLRGVFIGNYNFIYGEGREGRLSD